jgi:hypothetical protein
LVCFECFGFLSYFSCSRVAFCLTEFNRDAERAAAELAEDMGPPDVLYAGSKSSSSGSSAEFEVSVGDA